MSYAFIERHRIEWPIVIQCEVLRVSRSGFYSWRKRPPSATATRRAALAQEVREVHRISRKNYGAVRVHQALVQRGTKCDRKTVAKVMREAGIRSKTSRKFRVTTTDSNHPHPVAANVLARDFTADGDERQKGGQREGRMSVEKGATVEKRSEPRGLVMSTRLLGGSKDVDGGAVRSDSAEGVG